MKTNTTKVRRTVEMLTMPEYLALLDAVDRDRRRLQALDDKHPDTDVFVMHNAHLNSAFRKVLDGLTRLEA